MAKNYIVTASFVDTPHEEAETLIIALSKKDARKKFAKYIKENGGKQSDVKIKKIVEQLTKEKFKKLISKINKNRK